MNTGKGFEGLQEPEYFINTRLFSLSENGDNDDDDNKKKVDMVIT